MGFLGLLKLKVHPFVEHNEKIKVQVQYKETKQEFQVEPYTYLEEILNQMPLDDEANLDAINEKQILKNQDKIIIPIKTETACISINHASLDSLTQLVGVGEITAQRIIDYRHEHGYFQTIDTIKNVKGIGEKTFEKMKDQLCI